MSKPTSRICLIFIIVFTLIMLCSCVSSGNTSNEKPIVDEPIVESHEEPSYEYYRVCDGITSEPKGGKSISFSYEEINADRVDYTYFFYYVDTDGELTIEMVQEIMAEIYEAEKSNIAGTVNPGIYLWASEEIAQNNIPPEYAVWPDDENLELGTIVYKEEKNIYLPGVLLQKDGTKAPDVFNFYYYGYDNYDKDSVYFHDHWIEFINGEYTKVDFYN